MVLGCGGAERGGLFYDACVAHTGVVAKKQTLEACVAYNAKQKKTGEDR